MGDNNKDKSREVILTITLSQDGKVLVNGPIANEPLALWMLDKAKDIIKAHNIKLMLKEKPLIATPNFRG